MADFIIEEIKEKVREPSRRERGFIIGHIMEKDGIEYAEANDLVERARIAVFDNYMSDSPGYFGKVVVVVWPGAPDIVSVYIEGLREVKVIRGGQ